MDKNRVDTDTIKRYKAELKNIWWESPSDFPAFETRYDVSRQASMETEMEGFIDTAVAEVKKFPSARKGDSPEWGARLKGNIRNAGVNVLGFSAGSMDMLLDTGFLNSTYEFMDNARSFDPSMKMVDIMQAMRNVWIMNCIQLMLGRDVGYTPPLFAYSMLYPYTDNYLDAPGISQDKKAAVSRKLRLKLDGKPVEASNTYESQLFKLVGVIEGYFPRQSNPEVYESLLWIHDAQQNSLFQQQSVISPYEKDLLDLSFQKGGTSVLADAFLVKGTLTPEEVRFMFGFGVVLQLADDLQDAVEDRKNGHMTLFTQTAGKWPLDNVANKLFNFTYTVLESGMNLNSPVMMELSAIMKRSCILLLLGAIANNSGLFNRDYLKRVEAFSPLSFKYTRSMFKRVAREYRNLRLKHAGRPVEVYMAKALALGSAIGQA